MIYTSILKNVHVLEINIKKDKHFRYMIVIYLFVCFIYIRTLFQLRIVNTYILSFFLINDFFYHFILYISYFLKLKVHGKLIGRSFLQKHN